MAEAFVALCTLGCGVGVRCTRSSCRTMRFLGCERAAVYIVQVANLLYLVCYCATPGVRVPHQSRCMPSLRQMWAVSRPGTHRHLGVRQWRI